MSEEPDLERLLEAHAIGDLEDHARRVLEDALEGRDERFDPKVLSETLDYERALVGAFHVDGPPPQDVADAVLDRLYRRPALQDRRSFERNLAQEALDSAMETGRVTATKSQRRQYLERPGFVRAAGLVFFLLGLMFFSLRDFAKDDDTTSPLIPQSSRIMHVAELGFIADSKELDPERVTPPRDLDKIYEGGIIETRKDQVAIIVLPNKSGRVVIHPSSRVLISRVKNNPQPRFMIVRGGISTAIIGKQPITVASGSTHSGQVHGRSEVVLASQALGSNSALTNSSLNRSFLVRCESQGRAVFKNAADEIEIGNDELGVVGEASLVKLPKPIPTLNEFPARALAIEAVIADPGKLALRIGDRRYERAVIVREFLRIFGPDLMETLVRSAVIRDALQVRGLEIAEDMQKRSRQFVANDPLLKVMPLRGQAAVEERSFHVAGLLTLAASNEVFAWTGRGRVPVSAFCEQAWSQLSKGCTARWHVEEGKLLKLRIHRGKRLLGEIDTDDAWTTLTSFVRRNEAQSVLDDFVERQVIDMFLKAQGKTWPPLAWTPDAHPVRRAAQETLVHMSGITMRQFLDRQLVRQVVAAYEPAPPVADVDRFLVEEFPIGKRIVFEHITIPFCEAEQGFADDIVRERDLAEDLALRVTDNLRGLGTPFVLNPAKIRDGLWKNGWSAGPMPWWDEIYGPNFGRAVLSLREGEVSDPILGREAFHVVRMRHILASEVDPRARRQLAQATLLMQNARQRVEAMLANATMEVMPLEELLR